MFMKESFVEQSKGSKKYMDEWRDLKRMTKALSGVARLTIIYHLARHEAVTVSDLTNKLSISQPLVSWHLRKLRRAGLIETSRSGRLVYCSLNFGRFRQYLLRLEALIDPTTTSIHPVPIGAALIEADIEAEEED
jgi:ArsR family transcriptional regulator